MSIPGPSNTEEQAARRRRAVRTALVLGLVAAGIYVGFILSGVFAS